MKFFLKGSYIPMLACAALNYCLACSNNVKPTENNNTKPDASPLQLVLGEEGSPDFLLGIANMGNVSKYDYAFEKAARKWYSVIKSPVQLAIFFRVQEIDGVSGTVGEAQPISINATTGLPMTGRMDFDIADIEQLEKDNQLENTILHEMGHVLGLGTKWLGKNLTYSFCKTTPFDSKDKEPFYYLGKMAQMAYAALGLEGPLTVENNMGPGSKCVHWDEQILGNEIMTPSVDDIMIMSNITLNGLVDIGWEVDYSKAEELDVENLGIDDNDICAGTEQINVFVTCMESKPDDECEKAKMVLDCFQTSFIEPACQRYFEANLVQFKENENTFCNRNSTVDKNEKGRRSVVEDIALKFKASKKKPAKRDLNCETDKYEITVEQNFEAAVAKTKALFD